MSTEITQKYIKELFNYREDGKLLWKVVIKHNTDLFGKVAGHQSLNGYIRIKIGGKSYLAHRLIWLYFNETLPKYIDHINRDPTDNRIENLRSCSALESIGNTKKPRTGKSSKYKGVRLDYVRKKWTAQITIKRRSKYLGSFVSEEAAAKAYNKAALEHFGEFALLNKIEQ